jgi:hypothetical protein
MGAIFSKDSEQTKSCKSECETKYNNKEVEDASDDDNQADEGNKEGDEPQTGGKGRKNKNKNKSKSKNNKRKTKSKKPKTAKKSKK